MKNIRTMTVTQFRIFPPDLIPFGLIFSPAGTDMIQQVMGFGNVGRNADLIEIIFRNGSFKIDSDTPPIVVQEMRINARRIIVQVEGSSAVANQAYYWLKELCSRFDENFRDAEPTLLTEETGSVVELDFDWSSLLNPGLVAAADAFVARSVDTPVRQYVKTVSVQILIGTRIDDTLTDAGIVTAEKPLTIEPRIDVPLSDHVFFTRSPADSETHLALIRDLEARLTKRTVKRR